MNKLKKIHIIFILFILFSLTFSQVILAEEVKRMTKEELKTIIDNSGVVIVDVRSGRDWKSSESKIKNAVREEPYKADSWAKKYDKNNIFVLYCA